MRSFYYLSLLVLSFFFASIQSVKSQCTPDTTLTAGAFTTAIADGCTGSPYADVIYFALPGDVFGIPVDSVVLDTVENVPAGLLYDCNEPGCVYLGAGVGTTIYGCVDVSGTPTDTTPGSINIDALGTLYGGGLTFSETFSIALEVNEGVSSAFTYSVSGDTVDFMADTISGTYAWDFGDGTTSSMQNPTHVFTGSGGYTVCLVTYNMDSTCMDSVCQVVAISCTPATATFTWSDSAGTVSFTNSSSGDASATYSWDFGDTSSGSTDENPVHFFDLAGDYEVCMTITDSCGPVTFCDTITATTVGIFDDQLISDVKVFPVPAKDELHYSVSLHTGEKLDISLMDMNGRLLFQAESAEASFHEGSIDLHTIPSGLYLLDIKGETGRKAIRFVVE